MWLYCAADCIIYGYETDNYLQFRFAVEISLHCHCANRHPAVSKTIYWKSI